MESPRRWLRGWPLPASRLLPLPPHERGPELALRLELVMRATPKPHPVHRRLPPSRYGLDMVELEKPLRLAAVSGLADEGALAHIPLPHGTPYPCWDIALSVGLAWPARRDSACARRPGDCAEFPLLVKHDQGIEGPFEGRACSALGSPTSSSGVWSAVAFSGASLPNCPGASCSEIRPGICGMARTKAGTSGGGKRRARTPSIGEGCPRPAQVAARETDEPPVPLGCACTPRLRRGAAPRRNRHAWTRSRPGRTSGGHRPRRREPGAPRSSRDLWPRAEPSREEDPRHGGRTTCTRAWGDPFTGRFFE